MILSIEGEEATGKTSLALTAPLKVVSFQFDMGAERAVLGARYEEYFKDLTINTVAYGDGSSDTPANLSADITIFECPQPIQLDDIEVHGMVKLWNYFLVRLGEALRYTGEGTVRTIVIDTMTMARRIKIEAYLESLQDKARKSGGKMRERLQEIEYGTPNGAIRDIYTTCAAIKMNLVVTHHLQDERQDGMDSKGIVVSKKTGKRILEGLNQTYRFVDIAIRMTKSGSDLTAKFTKCGYNLSLEGIPVKDPTWDRLMGIIEGSLGDRLKLPKRVMV